MWDNVTETEIKDDKTFISDRGISKDLYYSSKLKANAAIATIIKEYENCVRNEVEACFNDDISRNEILENFYLTTLKPVNILISFFFVLTLILYVLQQIGLLQNSEYIAIPADMLEHLKIIFNENAWAEGEEFYKIHIPILYVLENIALILTLTINNRYFWLKLRVRGKGYSKDAVNFVQNNVFRGQIHYSYMLTYYVFSIFLTLFLYVYSDFIYLHYAHFVNNHQELDNFLFDYFYYPPVLDYTSKYFFLQLFNLFNTVILFFLKLFRRI